MQGSYGDSVEKFQYKQKTKRVVFDKKHSKARDEKLKDKWKHTETEYNSK